MDSENKSLHIQPVIVAQIALDTNNRSQKVGCPIRKSRDQSLFAAPPSLSQRTTSFIASQRQGIRRIPLRHLIVLEIRKRTLPLSLAGKPRHGASPRQTTPTPFSDFSKRPVLLQTHPGSLRSGSDHDWYALDSKFGDGLEVSLKSGAVSGRDRMRFLFTMSDSCRRPPRIPFRADIRPSSGCLQRLFPKIVCSAEPCGPRKTSDLQTDISSERRSRRRLFRTFWWSQTGSNRRPHACKARALPTELWPLGKAVGLRQ